MTRGDLSDTQWAKVQPILPPEKSGQKGHPYVEHRKVSNGILWRIRTGAPWRDIPARYGPYQTCSGTLWVRFVRFERKGIWSLILQSLQAEQDELGQLDWQQASVDGSVIRAHQHAAGAASRSSQFQAQAEFEISPASPSRKAQVQAAEALGYSRGGFSTKLHLVCDGRGRPLALMLSAAQAHESKHLASTLAAIRVPRRGRGVLNSDQSGCWATGVILDGLAVKYCVGAGLKP